MSELYQFVTKITSQFDGMTCRKIYGKDAIYYKENPLIVITDDRVAIKIKSLDELPKLKSAVEQWVLDQNPMEDWYLLPFSYNKKKNKLIPAIEQVIEFHKRPKMKVQNKPKKKKESIQHKVELTSNKPTKKKNLFQALFSFMK